MYPRKDIEMAFTLKTKAKVCWDYGSYDSFEGFDVEITTFPNQGWADGKLVLRVVDTPGCWLVRDLLNMDSDTSSININGDHCICVNFNVIMSELKALLSDPILLASELSV